ncbi:MAG: sugar kinase [Chloroflexota bacterium]
MILSAGDLMLDVLLLPELQKEEQPKGIVIRAGGSAANTAAWVVHLGGSAIFAGCVGPDAPGAILVQGLQNCGVQTSVRTVPSEDTGCVALEISATGERVMRSSRGANMALAPDDLRTAARTDLNAVHLTGYALLGPFEFEMLDTASIVARNTGATLSFDPSSTGVIQRFGADRLLREVVRVGVELFVPNCEEAIALTGETTAIAAATALGDSIPLVVVKDGERGAGYCWRGRSGNVSVEAVHPRDTTGAGDAFNAGILIGLQRGYDAEESCLLAHESALQVIREYGARPLTIHRG